MGRAVHPPSSHIRGHFGTPRLVAGPMSRRWFATCHMYCCATILLTTVVVIATTVTARGPRPRSTCLRARGGCGPRLSTSSYVRTAVRRRPHVDSCEDPVCEQSFRATTSTMCAPAHSLLPLALAAWLARASCCAPVPCVGLRPLPPFPSAPRPPPLCGVPLFSVRAPPWEFLPTSSCMLHASCCAVLCSSPPLWRCSVPRALLCSSAWLTSTAAPLSATAVCM